MKIKNFRHSSTIPGTFFIQENDAIHAFVQSPRKIAIAKMVRRLFRKNEEENHKGIDHYGSWEKTENVFVFGI